MKTLNKKGPENHDISHVDSSSGDHVSRHQFVARIRPYMSGSFLCLSFPVQVDGTHPRSKKSDQISVTSTV